MMQVVPMDIDQALTAAETYRSPINGGMVDVLADAVKRLRTEQLDVWAAIGATDVGQGLAWNVAAMVRLSRDRRDELDALRAEVRELRALSHSANLKDPP